ncbi:MAG TPA: ribosome small subunit-dependent GTPase A [Anaerolineales bacterium]|nr:ribosome small subunit-dependent GTPase A [Anaerolineales bacterium]
MPKIPGLVIRSQSGFYEVETSSGVVLARLRGRLKQGRAMGDLVTLGDRVQVSIEEGDEPMIEAVEPRKRALVRRDPRPQGLYEQVIVANPDQAVFVFACADPAPKLRMLDRFLVIAEAQGIPAVVVANKVDLVGMEKAQAMFAYYTDLGYGLLYTSAIEGQGVEALRAALQGRLSVLAGPSGAGKSSLMNLVQPSLDLRVGDVQQGSGKGKHTTVERQLSKLEGGGYVADTPGLKALALWNVQPEELDGYFPEMRDLIAGCQFRDCAHLEEPGCAVRAAVEGGKIHSSRYESYRLLRLGETKD